MFIKNRLISKESLSIIRAAPVLYISKIYFVYCATHFKNRQEYLAMLNASYVRSDLILASCSKALHIQETNKWENQSSK